MTLMHMMNASKLLTTTVGQMHQRASEGRPIGKGLRNVPLSPKEEVTGCS